MARPVDPATVFPPFHSVNVPAARRGTVDMKARQAALELERAKAAVAALEHSRALAMASRAAVDRKHSSPFYEAQLQAQRQARRR